MAHIGVKNRSKEPQTLTWDGKAYEFAAAGQKGDVRIIADVPHDHIVTRMHVKHATRKVKIEGEEVTEQLKQLEGHRLFEIIPLNDALKVAVPDEDPRIVAARTAAEDKAKERQALIAEVKDALKDELKAEVAEELKSKGWQPPQEESPKETHASGKHKKNKEEALDA